MNIREIIQKIIYGDDDDDYEFSEEETPYPEVPDGMSLEEYANSNKIDLEELLPCDLYEIIPAITAEELLEESPRTYNKRTNIGLTDDQWYDILSYIRTMDSSPKKMGKLTTILLVALIIILGGISAITANAIVDYVCNGMNMIASYLTSPEDQPEDTKDPTVPETTTPTVPETTVLETTAPTVPETTVPETTTPPVAENNFNENTLSELVKNLIDNFTKVGINVISPEGKNTVENATYSVSQKDVIKLVTLMNIDQMLRECPELVAGIMGEESLNSFCSSAEEVAITAFNHNLQYHMTTGDTKDFAIFSNAIKDVQGQEYVKELESKVAEINNSSPEEKVNKFNEFLNYVSQNYHNVPVGARSYGAFNVVYAASDIVVYSSDNTKCYVDEVTANTLRAYALLDIEDINRLFSEQEFPGDEMLSGGHQEKQAPHTRRRTPKKTI